MDKKMMTAQNKEAKMMSLWLLIRSFNQLRSERGLKKSKDDDR